MKPLRFFVRLSLGTAIGLLLAVPAFSQEVRVTRKQVPSAVLTAFKAAYPQATIRGYSREKENGKTYYEVESIDGQTTRDVLYNPDGTVAEIEESVPSSELPANAEESLRAKYPGAVITKVERSTRGDVTEYEAHARVGKKRVSMEFDANGKPLQQD